MEPITLSPLSIPDHIEVGDIELYLTPESLVSIEQHQNLLKLLPDTLFVGITTKGSDYAFLETPSNYPDAVHFKIYTNAIYFVMTFGLDEVEYEVDLSSPPLSE